MGSLPTAYMYNDGSVLLHAYSCLSENVSTKFCFREEVTAKRTTGGTYPPGSMWTANPIYPHMEEGGVDNRGHGHIIDVVHIPSYLAHGEYVLSFRWDSKCSPQVWTSCATIKIV